MKTKQNFNYAIKTETKEMKRNETIDNLKTLARIIAGLLFMYFMGHIFLSLILHFGNQEFYITDPIKLAVIKLGLGLPALLVQIEIMIFAEKLKNKL